MKLDAGIAGMPGQVGAASHRQIVDDEHVIATRGERVDDVAADETGAAGHQHAPRDRHACSSIFRSRRAGLPATIVPGRTSRGHHAAGADDRAFADLDAAEDRRARADRGAAADDRRHDFPVAVGLQFAGRPWSRAG